MVTIRGNDANNTIYQDNYAYVDIFAYGGDDRIYLNLTGRYGGFNYVEAGSGNDRVYNSFEGGNEIYLGDGNDYYSSIGFSTADGYYDKVYGGNGNDTFDVLTFQSDYYGQDGNDTFFSSGYANLFNGGTGTDTISFEDQSADSGRLGNGIRVDLYKGTATADGETYETLVSIENAVGTTYADTLLGTDGANRLWGSSGNDVLKGFGGNDRLYGESGNDNLSGGAGNDFLVGGAGRDVQSGGTGADRFVFSAVSESRAGSNRDVISDFHGSEGDLIDLSGIDADTTYSGNQSFDFIGRTAFTGSAGELRFASGVLSGDVNGDGLADFQVTVSGVTTLYHDDLIL